VVRKKRIHYEASLAYYRRYYSAKSSECVRGPTNHTNPVLQTAVQPARFLERIAKELSDEYLFSVTKVNTSNPVPGSLLERATRALSWHNFIYEPFSTKLDVEGRQIAPLYRCLYSTNTMNPEKQVKLLREFSNDTAYRGAGFMKMRKYMPNGLYFLEKALDCDRFEGKTLFRYDVRQALSFLQLTTGGGINPTKCGVTEYDGYKVIVHNSGKKIYLFEAAIRYFHEWILSVMAGNYKPFIDFEVIREKQEWKKFDGLVYEELTQLFMSMREFFYT